MGPRYWEKVFRGELKLMPPTAPIISMPLRYEYAFGGECRIDRDDPDGQRADAAFTRPKNNARVIPICRFLTLRATRKSPLPISPRKAFSHSVFRTIHRVFMHRMKAAGKKLFRSCSTLSYSIRTR